MNGPRDPRKCAADTRLLLFVNSPRARRPSAAAAVRQAWRQQGTDQNFNGLSRRSNLQIARRRFCLVWWQRGERFYDPDALPAARVLLSRSQSLLKESRDSRTYYVVYIRHDERTTITHEGSRWTCQENWLTASKPWKNCIRKKYVSTRGDARALGIAAVAKMEKLKYLYFRRHYEASSSCTWSHSLGPTALQKRNNRSVNRTNCIASLLEGFHHGNAQLATANTTLTWIVKFRFLLFHRVHCVYFLAWYLSGTISGFGLLQLNR